MMISAGEARRPRGGLALGTGADIIGVKFVAAGMSQPQFAGNPGRTELSGVKAVELVTKEWRRQPFAELKFIWLAE